MYREYTQKELDAQYNMRARHPEFQDHFDLWERESERVRATLHCMLDIAYGDSPGQTLDIFPAQTLGAPVIVFIHGGDWQGLDKKSFSYVAEPLVAAGAAVAVINYDLPQDDQHYIHRIGRTARMGQSGRAFTLVLAEELTRLREIQYCANTRITRHATPFLKGKNKAKRSHTPFKTRGGSGSVHANQAL